MTVKDLIQKLQIMNQEALVAIDIEEYLDKPTLVNYVRESEYSENLVVIE